ncbi:MAG: FkbM family methyltransferase [Pseudomonadota bacterium]
MFSLFKSATKRWLGKRFSVYKIPNHNLFGGLLSERAAFRIVDVGANNGGFTTKLMEVFDIQVAAVVFVEPDPRCMPSLESLRDSFSRSGVKAEIIASAVDKDDMPKELFVTGDAAHNSLLRPVEFAFQEVEVPCRTGEQILSSTASLFESDGPTLLKVDVQGKELDVLLSFGVGLAFFDYIVCEYTFEGFYEISTSFSSLMALLEPEFDLVSILSQVYDLQGRLQYCNLLLKRRSC